MAGRRGRVVWERATSGLLEGGRLALTQSRIAAQPRLPSRIAEAAADEAPALHPAAFDPPACIATRCAERQ
jgi:hypothetical protein